MSSPRPWRSKSSHGIKEGERQGRGRRRPREAGRGREGGTHKGQSIKHFLELLMRL